MSKEKMTLHRALAELKLIDAKISKKTSEITPVGSMQKGKKVEGFWDKDDFIKDTKAAYQSVTDLINRKIAIKTAIVEANSKTKVKIGKAKMTIADAISYKVIVEQKRTLYSNIGDKLKRCMGNINVNNEKVNAHGLEIAKTALSNSEAKPTDEDAVGIINTFVTTNEFHLVDPLKAEKLVEKETDDLDEFMAEVDATLSEANATTFIEI